MKNPEENNNLLLGYFGYFSSFVFLFAFDNK